MEVNPVKVVILIIICLLVITLGVTVPIFASYDFYDIFKPSKLELLKSYTGRMVLDYVPLIDGHNDLAYNLYSIEKNQINLFPFDSNLTKYPVWNETKSSHTDLMRLRKGKVGGQFWSAYVDCERTQFKDAVERTLDQIDVIKRLIKKYPKDLKLTTSAEGIWEAFDDKKIASLIGVEGGHSIDSRLGILRTYYELGVRYMTLTHTCNEPWVDASPIDNDVANVKRNLTSWGRRIIWEMNRLGMMVDLSHVSYGTMHAVLSTSRAPVIFSHSSIYSVHNHHRNVHDDILMKLKENGGIIMICFSTNFIGGNGTMDDVIKHFNYVRDLIGTDHIGIGADYDGTSTLPIGLEDTSKYPELFDRLAEKEHNYTAWSSEDLKKIAGLNLIRVMKKVEETAEYLEYESPQEILIPDVDLYNAGNQTCRTDFFYQPPPLNINGLFFNN